MQTSLLPSPLNLVLSGLRDLGYRDGLLRENYAFPDWFAAQTERIVDAAAFGSIPASTETALIGVVSANGQREKPLVNRCRALGAPIVLEIDGTTVREWAVSPKANRHALRDTYSAYQLREVFADRAPRWRPDQLLRAKNIGSFDYSPELDLFTGLIPELEAHIQEVLEPLLRSALSAAKRAYLESAGLAPDARLLYRIVFWVLAAKIFHDRSVTPFSKFTSDPDPEELLRAVAGQYRFKEDSRLPLNRAAREAAVKRLWSKIDFRNLSVEVLANLWSTALLDTTTKKTLAVHRTSRTIVRYIVDRIPFDQAGLGKRFVVEPCCGSSVFLVGAMNKLRSSLFGQDDKERHEYFAKHLVGIESDPFSIEVSHLALTLADFPHSHGWQVLEGDVFERGVMTPYVSSAGVVLCNPPFSPFSESEKDNYNPTSPLKPAALLDLVLDDLHPSGMLGFVLPQAFVDGNSYAPIRQRLAERFESLRLTILPAKRAFDADVKTCILIATNPIPHQLTKVSLFTVHDTKEAWRNFELTHRVSSEQEAAVTPQEAGATLGIPELHRIWTHLVNFPVLADVADVHRGVEWNLPLTKKGGGETGHRRKFVRTAEAAGFRLGVPPRAKFNMFEMPTELRYLSLRNEDKYGNANERAWDLPKAIVNKTRRSRSPWRLAAFPDSGLGLACYQTFTGVWPKSRDFDEVLLAAVLNSPVANAYLSTREGVDNTVEVLQRIPVPHFTAEQANTVRRLVTDYQRARAEDKAALLVQIDATVLSGYRMPPVLERELLGYFDGAQRIVAHEFGPYPGVAEDVFFSLADRVDPQFSEATAGALLRRLGSS